MALPFKIGCWHPFGPHGGETPDRIIERKRGEIAANGWTLWSFQYRRPQVLEEWYRELLANGGPTVFALCSDSARALDPAEAGVPGRTTECRSYRLVDKDDWLPCPVGVKVMHPFRGARKQASAFVVQRIVYPVEPFSHPNVEWLSKGRWRQERVPTRGEYLIRSGGATPLRAVRAMLELRAPYLALVRADEVS